MRLRTSHQRGFNLVEIGIILAVIGLLLGASLISLTTLSREDKNRAEQAQLSALQDAIIGYALTHSTRARQVEINSASAAASPYVFTLPEARPYLPCPDMDGDGYEDRGGVSNGLGILPAASVLQLTISGSASADNPLLSVGNCLAGRGILPWKTLGVPAADQWGNRYTYQVDDAFSNALVGFNQNTIPDSFDVRIPIEPVSGDLFSYAHRLASAVTMSVALNDGTTYPFSNSRLPFVVCDTATNTAGCVSGNLLALTLKAGVVASVAFQAPRRNYNPNDVIEGVAYAIVSHGHNGDGAVGHVRNDLGLPFYCNPPIYQKTTTPIITLLPRHLNEAGNFPFNERTMPAALAYCPQPGFGGAPSDNQMLVDGVRVREDIDSRLEFDDLVVWSMRRDVYKPLVQAQQLPAKDMPVLYFPR